MTGYNLFTKIGSLRLRGRGTGNPGFTAIELLFVMVIIALLAVIAIPAYRNFIQKARETAVVSYISKVKNSEEVYRLQTASGAYTGDFDELETTGLIPPSTGANMRIEHDYSFSISAGVDGNNQPFWSLTANPVAASSTAKYFYVGNNVGIRFMTGAPANASSPPFSP